MLNFFKKNKLESDLISNNESFFEIELIALLFAYEIARSDGEIDEKELNLILNKIKDISKQLSKNENEILEIISKNSKDNISFNDFINDINKEFSIDEKNQMIKFLWEVAYADSFLDVNEERLIRRIADLINIKDLKVLKLKDEAKNRI